jgi:23S rRNA (cytosine1962-C5)-methyltransferase
MLFLKPVDFSDYQLIDSGSYKKLEKFGSFILSRPEPQAVWDTSLTEKEWDKLAQAEFQRNRGILKKGNGF